MDLMQYAFIDESGTVGCSGGTRHLVVALLSTKRARDIELLVHKTMRKFSHRIHASEIKASKHERNVAVALLHSLSKADIEIYSTIIDQLAIRQPPRDPEAIYRYAVSLTIQRFLEICPRADICIDRRYTKDLLRFELELRIREAIQDTPHKILLIHQEDSVRHTGLQAVDGVAWALFQKYERGNNEYIDIIANKIIYEELIQERNWKGIKEEIPLYGGHSQVDLPGL